MQDDDEGFRFGLGRPTTTHTDVWRLIPTLAEIEQPGNVIQLRPGVAYAMAKLSGLLQPALKWLWAYKVWKSNRQLFQGGLDVQQYVFEDRIPLDQIQPALIAFRRKVLLLQRHNTRSATVSCRSRPAAVGHQDERAGEPRSGVPTLQFK